MVSYLVWKDENRLVCISFGFRWLAYRWLYRRLFSDIYVIEMGRGGKVYRESIH